MPFKHYKNTNPTEFAVNGMKRRSLMKTLRTQRIQRRCVAKKCCLFGDVADVNGRFEGLRVVDEHEAIDIDSRMFGGIKCT